MQPPDWIKAVILGVLEGFTEFLPVSSTGHLLVAEQWLKVESEVFTVFIQLGALAAVWWLYRDRLVRMFPWGPRATSEGRRLSLYVILAFLPAAIVGYGGHHWIKEHLFSVQAIAWASIGGGIVILVVESLKPRVIVERLEAITPGLALGIGIGQCFALYPGISRSGATIIAALLLGLSRSAAIEFTFLLAVPTMTAASLYELWKYHQDLSFSMIQVLLIGALAAYGVALVVVRWFIRFVQTHTFEGFAWYRIVAGAFLLGLLANGFF